MTYSQSKFLLSPGQVISEVWNEFTALSGGESTAASAEPETCHCSNCTKWQL